MIVEFLELARTRFAGVEAILWGLVLLLLLATVFLGLHAEYRHYRQLGKGRSWWQLRLAFPVLLALTAAAVLLPARSVSGLEGLAAFYLALVVIGPLVWFASHAIVGRLLKPQLSWREGLAMAMVGLACMLGPAFVVNVAQGPIHHASRTLHAYRLERTAEAPLPFRVHEVSCFTLAGSVLCGQTLEAESDLVLERVDIGYGKPTAWNNAASVMHPTFCREGHNLHLAWIEGNEPPPLRLFWRRSGSGLSRSFYQVSANVSTAPRRPFEVIWRDDGFDLPLPLSRERLRLGWPGAVGQAWRYVNLDFLQPGETFDENCVMPGYRRLSWQKEGVVQGIRILLLTGGANSAVPVELRRPAASAGNEAATHDQ